MTENYPTAPANPLPEADPAGTTPAGDQGTVGVAKEQAATVGHGAADAGQQVAAVAKDQAQNVAAEVGTQAKDLLKQARTELTGQAGQQQQRLATGLRALGDELDSMARHSGQPGVASDLARQASARSYDVATWLDSREPGQLVEELKGFARQRPVVFLGLAAGAGLLAGRLTRGLKAASDDDTPGSPDASDPATVTPAPAVSAGRVPAVEPVRPFASGRDVSEGFRTGEDGL
jgi:hypothetical protein